MNKNHQNTTKICNILSALLSLALIVCQFLPFWEVNGETSSICGFVWRPSSHEAFTVYLQNALNDTAFYAGTLAMPNIILLLSGAAGFVFSLRNWLDKWPAILCGVCGLTGVITYLVYPAMRMGSMWSVHMAVSAVLVVLACVTLAAWCREKKAEKQAARA